MSERPFLPPRRSIFAGSFFSLKGNFFFVLSTYNANMAFCSDSTLLRMRDFMRVDLSHWIQNEMRRTPDLMMGCDAGSGLRNKNSSRIQKQSQYGTSFVLLRTTICTLVGEFSIKKQVFLVGQTLTIGFPFTCTIMFKTRICLAERPKTYASSVLGGSPHGVTVTFYSPLPSINLSKPNSASSL